MFLSSFFFIDVNWVILDVLTKLQIMVLTLCNYSSKILNDFQWFWWILRCQFSVISLEIVKITNKNLMTQHWIFSQTKLQTALQQQKKFVKRWNSLKSRLLPWQHTHCLNIKNLPLPVECNHFWSNRFEKKNSNPHWWRCFRPKSFCCYLQKFVITVNKTLLMWYMSLFNSRS